MIEKGKNTLHSNVPTLIWSLRPRVIHRKEQLLQAVESGMLSKSDPSLPSVWYLFLAVRTGYHRLGGLDDKYLFLSSGGWKDEIRMLSWSGSGEGPLPGL